MRKADRSKLATEVTVSTFPGGQAPTHIVVRLCHHYGMKVAADEARPDVIMLKYGYKDNAELRRMLGDSGAQVQVLATNDPTLPYQPSFR